MSGLSDEECESLCTCPWGAGNDLHTFACSQRIRAVQAIVRRAVNQALSEASDEILPDDPNCGCDFCATRVEAAREVRDGTT